jgi:hypothetical protein
MSMRFPILGLPLLLFGVIGCDRTNLSSTAPTPAVSAGASSDLSFAVEPVMLRPESIGGQSCARSPFGTRVIIRIRGGGDVFLRGIRFRFVDRFGVSSLPRVTPIPGSAPLTAPFPTLPVPASPIPTGVAPLPLPTSAPITNPGTTLPFFLAFDCGLAQEGTMFVDVETADRNGRTRTSALQARVGF